MEIDTAFAYRKDLTDFPSRFAHFHPVKYFILSFG